MISRGENLTSAVREVMQTEEKQKGEGERGMRRGGGEQRRSEKREEEGCRKEWTT